MSQAHHISAEQAAHDADIYKQTFKGDADGSKHPEALKQFQRELHAMEREPAAVRAAFFKSLAGSGESPQLPGLTISQDAQGGKVVTEGQGKHKHKVYSETEDKQVHAGEGPEAAFRRQGMTAQEALKRGREVRDAAGIGPKGFKQGEEYSKEGDDGAVRRVNNPNGGHTLTHFKGGKPTGTDTVDPDGTKHGETYADDGKKLATKYTEDKEGKRETIKYQEDGKTPAERVIEEPGKKTTVKFDKDRKVSEISTDTLDADKQPTSRVTTQFDSHGRRTFKESDTFGPDSVKKKETVSDSYDAQGRLSKEVRASEDASGRSEVIDDVAGKKQQKTITKPDGSYRQEITDTESKSYRESTFDKDGQFKSGTVKQDGKTYSIGAPDKDGYSVISFDNGGSSALPISAKYDPKTGTFKDYRSVVIPGTEFEPLPWSPPDVKLPYME